jgi:hypothetical protein
VCDLETSRMGAPYIYDISRLRVNHFRCSTNICTQLKAKRMTQTGHAIGMRRT